MMMCREFMGTYVRVWVSCAASIMMAGVISDVFVGEKQNKKKKQIWKRNNEEEPHEKGNNCKSNSINGNWSVGIVYHTTTPIPNHEHFSISFIFLLFANIMLFPYYLF